MTFSSSACTGHLSNALWLPHSTAGLSLSSQNILLTALEGQSLNINGSCFRTGRLQILFPIFVICLGSLLNIDIFVFLSIIRKSAIFHKKNKGLITFFSSKASWMPSRRSYTCRFQRLGDPQKVGWGGQRPCPLERSSTAWPGPRERAVGDPAEDGDPLL